MLSPLFRLARDAIARSSVAQLGKMSGVSKFNQGRAQTRSLVPASSTINAPMRQIRRSNVEGDDTERPRLAAGPFCIYNLVRGASRRAIICRYILFDACQLWPDRLGHIDPDRDHCAVLPT